MKSTGLLGRHVRVKGRDDIGRVVYQYGRRFAATPDDVWGVIVRFDKSREIGWYEISDLELVDK